MFCANCGKQIPDGTVFCPECGSKQTAQTAKEAPKAEPKAAPQPKVETQNAGVSFDSIRERNIPLNLLLSLVTCGIYSLFWFYSVITDLNTASGEKNAMPGSLVLILNLVTCGIYGWIWYFKAGEKVSKLRTASGQSEDRHAGILYLILAIINMNLVNLCLLQNELNNVATVKGTKF